MADQHVRLLERSLVEKVGYALTSGELALLVLAIDCPAATSVKRLLAEPAELFDASLGTHERSLRKLAGRIDLFDSALV
jgi:hypothetical protein